MSDFESCRRFESLTPMSSVSCFHSRSTTLRSARDWVSWTRRSVWMNSFRISVSNVSQSWVWSREESASPAARFVETTESLHVPIPIGDSVWRSCTYVDPTGSRIRGETIDIHGRMRDWSVRDEHWRLVDDICPKSTNEWLTCGRILATDRVPLELTNYTREVSDRSDNEEKELDNRWDVTNEKKMNPTCLLLLSLTSLLPKNDDFFLLM